MARVRITQEKTISCGWRLMEHEGGYGVWLENRRQANKSIATYVMVKPCRAAMILAFRSLNVSCANCGSSLTLSLYWETNIVRIAIPSVSKNLWDSDENRSDMFDRFDGLSANACTGTCRYHLSDFYHPTLWNGLPALKGKNASRGQSPRKREGLNAWGSSQ